MFLLSRPDPSFIQSFIDEQKDQQFSYAEVGRSREDAPRGYNRDHNRVQLGKGKDAFDRAKAAVQEWKMFDIPWVNLCWPSVPVEPGTTVAVLVSHFGFWSLNACRIVYVIEEYGALERYGFAYGTLPEHGEIGEERFIVEFDSHECSVWYDILAFSRPGPLTRLTYPLTRALQRRFARESKFAMARATMEDQRS
jgi:uncharacterized protein (UPF0548 family)